MGRPWRAGGDGRGISFPELPWKRKKHVVTLHSNEDLDPRALHWFSCRCGVSGPQRRVEDVARWEGQWHEVNA